MPHESVGDLLSVLGRIEQAIGGAASKTPRSQILKTIAFLQEHEGKAVTDLIATLEAAKPQPKIKTPRSSTAKPRTAKPKEPVRHEVVDSYVHRLRSSESSLDEFAALMAKLKADKTVRLDELKQIVPRYAGDTSALKSKPTALGVIQRAFDMRWSLRQHPTQTQAAQ